MPTCFPNEVWIVATPAIHCARERREIERERGVVVAAAAAVVVDAVLRCLVTWFLIVPLCTHHMRTPKGGALFGYAATSSIRAQNSSGTSKCVYSPMVGQGYAREKETERRGRVQGRQKREARAHNSAIKGSGF